MTTSSPAHFARQHDSHLKHLKLKGLQPKTIDACARAIRRLGGYFDYRIEALTLIAPLHFVLRIAPRPPMPDKPRPAFLYPCCGKPMQILRRRLPPMAASRAVSVQATEIAV